jgi:hypothetical protein
MFLDIFIYINAYYNWRRVTYCLLNDSHSGLSKVSSSIPPPPHSMSYYPIYLWLGPYVPRKHILIIISNDLRRDTRSFCQSHEHTHCPFAPLPHSFKRSRGGLWQIYGFPCAPHKQYALSISILFGTMYAWELKGVGEI